MIIANIADKKSVSLLIGGIIIKKLFLKRYLRSGRGGCSYMASIDKFNELLLFLTTVYIGFIT